MSTIGQNKKSIILCLDFELISYSPGFQVLCGNFRNAKAIGMRFQDAIGLKEKKYNHGRIQLWARSRAKEMIGK